MPWQVVSYAFLHGDVLHLFFNMLGLWMFGSELERLWGQQAIIMHFLIAGSAGRSGSAVAFTLPDWCSADRGCSARCSRPARLRHAVRAPLFPPIPEGLLACSAHSSCVLHPAAAHFAHHAGRLPDADGAAKPPSAAAADGTG